MTDEPAVTEENLTADELQDRAWAVLAAVAEERGADVDELLVTLPWRDLVAVVYGIANVTVGFMAGSHDFPLTAAERTRVVVMLRGMLLNRAAGRDEG